MADDVESADRLARIETKLDTVLTIIPDHETRLRIVEQKKEECQQRDQISDLRDTVGDHETRLNALESCHDQDTGAKQALMSYRELAAWGLTGLLGFITIYQFVKGGL